MSARGGDLGWFERKGPEIDEPLLAAAWELKVGEMAKPMEGSRGWHILKVTDREPARFTFFGAKERVVGQLTRDRLEKLIEQLRAKANIVKYL